MTQKNSRKRVKEDGIGQDRIQELYSQYESKNYIDFIKSCVNVVEESNASSKTKDKFVRLLQSSNSKDKAIRTVTNFYLAGSGLGV